MNCPCNYDIPDEKLCAGQLAWRKGYEDCCENVEVPFHGAFIGAPIEYYSNYQAMKAMNICKCKWCLNLLSRYATATKAGCSEYFDCHDGLNAQCRIDDARDSNKDESSFRLRECDCCR